MGESILHVDERCCGLKKAEVSAKKQVLLRMTSTELGGADWLFPRATIDALPDNVLLETFEFYLGKDDDEIYFDHNCDAWQMLVHVCRRWRCIVFASPRRLDLKLYCTRQRSANSKTLDIWPALPIVIFAEDMQSKEDVTSVVAALRHHNRVCKIYYRNGRFQDSLLKEFAAIEGPFPALTSLHLSSSQQQNVPALPDSFLRGSAPRLRSLHLSGIPYPSIGNLLSSTTNLVQLSLRHIPYGGYLAPETIVLCLSMLPRLKSLFLGFQYPRSQAHRASRHPPPLTRVVFPNLASLHFRGNIEYLEDILSQIETPILNESYFCFFNQLVFATPLLGHFIHRTDTFLAIHRARVQFFRATVVVTLLGREEMAHNDREALELRISCRPLDWQLSALSQVLSSFSLPTLESLDIEISREDWQGEIEVSQWREFSHLFTSVKDMTLQFDDSVRLVAPALQELSGESATEVLPALQNLFLKTYNWQRLGPVKEAIEQFITTRQLSGHPVTVHY